MLFVLQEKSNLFFCCIGFMLFRYTSAENIPVINFDETANERFVVGVRSGTSPLEGQEDMDELLTVVPSHRILRIFNVSFQNMSIDAEEGSGFVIESRSFLGDRNGARHPFLLTIGLPVLYHESPVADAFSADLESNVSIPNSLSLLNDSAIFIWNNTDITSDTVNYNVTGNSSSSNATSVISITNNSTNFLNTTNKSTIQTIVRNHNFFRKSVQPPAMNMLRMNWHHESAVLAQQWAEKCSANTSGQISRDNSGFSCGQNLARSLKPMTWDKVITMWHDEAANFNYDGEQNDTATTSHYTQIVWASSYLVGCGYKFCANFHYYVCNYCPSGNVLGQRNTPYKIGQRCGDCRGSCRASLCSNPCPYQDAYSNCEDLDKTLKICNAGQYQSFRDRCLATCSCKGKIY